jgi:sporulation protein YlmC with PRC-barrel domain
VVVAYRCAIRLELGTPVRCADGTLGALADVVIDPTRRCVTHLVVKPGDQPGLMGARLVPIELAGGGQEKPEIVLSCTVEDVRRLEPVQEVAYLRLGGFPVDDPDWDVGISAVLATPYYGPAELGEFQDASDAQVIYDRIPKDEVEIRRSSAVTSKDGHHLGSVEAFILDSEGQVTHFVLERGHLWGKRDVTIPIGAVKSFETDEVILSLTKDEVGALPAVRVRRWRGGS